ncbi:histidine phosphatase family protein [Primorskyibacter sedentarius]|uniref:histidine phosphatase family protein n=1 Tax=Primorskyibacter sedentarius TaxID=745311 RepID=UPI003EBABAB7
MSHVILIRHGQANTTARDEGSYDRLSELGWQQSRWLGEHLRAAGDRFARCYTGTLTRHIETCEGIAPDSAADPIRDPRLNELEYFTMAQLFAEQHGQPVPLDREGFIHHLPQLFGAWKDGLLKGAPESFDGFENRVGEALHEIAQGDGRAIVVTSGGLIGMAMRVTMRLDMAAYAHACLAIKNTSLHGWQPLATGLALTQFNATPHLETPERQFAQTHL